MKRIILATLISVILCVVLFPSITLPRGKTNHFQPGSLLLAHGGRIEAIIWEWSKAKSTVLVQAYNFISAPIAPATPTSSDTTGT
jgi:hypothetical protein